MRNRETVLTWLTEARNEPLLECGDEYVLTAVALGSAERRQGLLVGKHAIKLQCQTRKQIHCPVSTT
jgi:hypothetical protein